MALLSKGIKLNNGTKALTNLQSTPDLGGTTESVEVTTLADDARTYINGLISYGDSLNFVFLYEEEQFATLSALTGTQDWNVELPNGKKCSFTGEPTVKLNSATTNSALTYTLSIKPNSKMIWA